MQELLVWQQKQVTANCSIDQLHAALEDEHAVVWLDIQTGGKLASYNDLLTRDFHLPKLVMDSIAEEKERAKLVEIHDSTSVLPLSEMDLREGV